MKRRKKVKFSSEFAVLDASNSKILMSSDQFLSMFEKPPRSLESAAMVLSDEPCECSHPVQYFGEAFFPTRRGTDVDRGVTTSIDRFVEGFIMSLPPREQVQAHMYFEYLYV